MSKLSDKLDVPLSPSLYQEWLRSDERFKMYYDQWLEREILRLRSQLSAFADRIASQSDLLSQRAEK